MNLLLLLDILFHPSVSFRQLIGIRVGYRSVQPLYEHTSVGFLGLQNCTIVTTVHLGDFFLPPLKHLYLLAQFLIFFTLPTPGASRLLLSLFLLLPCPRHTNKKNHAMSDSVTSFFHLAPCFRIDASTL